MKRTSSFLSLGALLNTNGFIIPASRQQSSQIISSNRRTSVRLFAKRGNGKVKKDSVSKSNLPEKICVVCDRPFTWRKKWERCWDEVTCCSKSCNSKRRGGARDDGFVNYENWIGEDLMRPMHGNYRCNIISIKCYRALTFIYTVRVPKIYSIRVFLFQHLRSSHLS